jgi:hypothetical protein
MQIELSHAYPRKEWIPRGQALPRTATRPRGVPPKAAVVALDEEPAHKSPLVPSEVR